MLKICCPLSSKHSNTITEHEIKDRPWKTAPESWWSHSRKGTQLYSAPPKLQILYKCTEPWEGAYIPYQSVVLLHTEALLCIQQLSLAMCKHLCCLRLLFKWEKFLLTFLYCCIVHIINYKRLRNKHNAQKNQFIQLSYMLQPCRAIFRKKNWYMRKYWGYKTVTAPSQLTCRCNFSKFLTD